MWRTRAPSPAWLPRRASLNGSSATAMPPVRGLARRPEVLGQLLGHVADEGSIPRLVSLKRFDERFQRDGDAIGPVVFGGGFDVPRDIPHPLGDQAELAGHPRPGGPVRGAREVDPRGPPPDLRQLGG